MVIGSNGQIAWGLTNSGGNWSDLIEIDVDPADADGYLTAEGKRPFEHHREVIKIKGQADEPLEILSTIWGPVIDRDHQRRPRALRWVALDPDGVNLNLVHMAELRTTDEALALAPTCGVPHVNLVVGDARGRIGWTIMGRIPRRTGEGDSRFPLRGKDEAGTWQRILWRRGSATHRRPCRRASSGRPTPGWSTDRCSRRSASATTTGAVARG